GVAVSLDRGDVLGTDAAVYRQRVLNRRLDDLLAFGTRIITKSRCVRRSRSVTSCTSCASWIFVLREKPLGREGSSDCGSLGLSSASVPCGLCGQSLLEVPAPLEAVLRTEDAAHPEPVIFGRAARVAGDDHVIAWLEGVVRDAAQLTRSRPFNGPALDLPLVVRCLHVDEGMRIPEHERHQLAFDL